MPLTAGDKLGPYEIVAMIGEGGMGEVYRARDLRLNRDVAVKVSKDQFSERFEREARSVAALNHPNICHLYDVGRSFLVMEFVEGETVSDLIEAGPLPVDTAINYARQIADAIEAAHEKGIVHRDLKPANIKVTPSGTVKVLDFGLAKALEEDFPSPPAQDSPTLSLAMTRAGMILGTAAYMSPEQAKGKPADRRADIWAFGVVLFEMLSGQQVFAGDTAAETLASVLKDPIAFDRLPKDTPPAVRHLLSRCLNRDIRQRLQAIGEARIMLEGPLDPVGQVPDVPSRSRNAWLWPSLSVLLVLLLAALATLHFREIPPAEHTLRFSLPVPNGGTFIHSFALSHDGRSAAMVVRGSGKQELWLQSLDALQPQLIPLTEGALYPFWSPDDRFIAFFADNKLKKIAATGGPAEVLCDAPGARGGTWSREDVILFGVGRAPNAIIRRVPAKGGTPADLNGIAGTFPVFLPDGGYFLYRQSPSPAVYLASLDGKENQRILPDQSSVAFAHSGRAGAGQILFIRDNNLMALPFDSRTRQISGDVFPVAAGVALSQNGYAPVAVSENGVLAYWAGGGGGASNQLLWYDAAGKSTPLAAPGSVWEPAISPDGKTIAYSRNTGVGLNSDIWLWDVTHTGETRLTTDASQNDAPVWSPSGDRVLFRSLRSGQQQLYTHAASGAGQDELLPTTPDQKFASQWFKDGSLVFTDNAGAGLDVWVMPMGEHAGEGKAAPFLHSAYQEGQGQISPDGHWMAYSSDKSGPREVYVTPFPSGGDEWRISKTGGEQPRWRGDGKALFFIAADGKMMTVEVKPAPGPKPAFDWRMPASLFDTHIATAPGTSANQYDMTKDGKQFLVTTSLPGTATSATPLIVRVNWDKK